VEKVYVRFDGKEAVFYGISIAGTDFGDIGDSGCCS
jgi:hypothetical protein